MLVISAPEPGDGAEASIEQNTENQAPTPSPSLGGVEKGENSLGDEKSNHGNEIITPTDDLLPHNPDVAQPTLDNSVKDVLPEPPQAEGEEPGEVNELVEDSTGTTGTKTYQYITVGTCVGNVKIHGFLKCIFRSECLWLYNRL